jgi:hypothetical protein
MNPLTHLTSSPRWRFCQPLRRQHAAARRAGCNHGQGLALAGRLRDARVDDLGVLSRAVREPVVRRVLRPVPLIVMPFALVLIVCALATPNPTLVGRERCSNPPIRARHTTHHARIR